VPGWEFREVLLAWNKERKAWISEGTSTQPELASRSAVLAHYGGEGWDLVGVLVPGYEWADVAHPCPPGLPGRTTTIVTEWTASRYLFYFKRLKED
jgi:hypothetical protein